MARIAGLSRFGQALKLDGVGTRLRDLIDRHRCLLCGDTALLPVAICAGCQADLPVLRADAGLLRRRDAIDALWCGYRYSFPIDRLIAAMKYRGDLVAGRLLQHLFVERMAAASMPAPEVLVPVPLHWLKLMRRGFNQAALLGNALGASMHIPIRHERRRQRGPAQSALGADARVANMRDAFVVRGDWRGRYAMIIDDVVTTGATVNALARALKAAGCARVDVAVLAQTVLPH